MAHYIRDVDGSLEEPLGDKSPSKKTIEFRQHKKTVRGKIVTLFL